MVQRLVNSFVILLFAIFLISGCSITDDKTKEYYNSAKEFNNVYFQVVEQIEINGDEKSIEMLQSEDNRAKIEKLGKLLEIIKQTVPEDRLLHYYGFRERYDDLVFLRDSYGKLDKMREEERGRIDRAVIMINYYKADWEDKKSNTVWE